MSLMKVCPVEALSRPASICNQRMWSRLSLLSRPVQDLQPISTL